MRAFKSLKIKKKKKLGGTYSNHWTTKGLHFQESFTQDVGSPKIL